MYLARTPAVVWSRIRPWCQRRRLMSPLAMGLSSTQRSRVHHRADSMRDRVAWPSSRRGARVHSLHERNTAGHRPGDARRRFRHRRRRRNASPRGRCTRAPNLRRRARARLPQPRGPAPMYGSTRPLSPLASTCTPHLTLTSGIAARLVVRAMRRRGFPPTHRCRCRRRPGARASSVSPGMSSEGPPFSRSPR